MSAIRIANNMFGAVTHLFEVSWFAGVSLAIFLSAVAFLLVVACACWARCLFSQLAADFISELESTSISRDWYERRIAVFRIRAADGDCSMEQFKEAQRLNHDLKSTSFERRSIAEGFARLLARRFHGIEAHEERLEVGEAVLKIARHPAGADGVASKTGDGTAVEAEQDEIGTVDSAEGHSIADEPADDVSSSTLAAAASAEPPGSRSTAPPTTSKQQASRPDTPGKKKAGRTPKRPRRSRTKTP